jgi:hypothetical protein
MKGRDNNASHLPYILTKGVYGSRKWYILDEKWQMGTVEFNCC